MDKQQMLSGIEFTKFYIGHSLVKRKKLILRFAIVAFCFALVVITLVFSKSMIRGMNDKIVYLSSGHLSADGRSEEVIEALFKDSENIRYEKTKKTKKNGMKTEEKLYMDGTAFVLSDVITGYVMIYTGEGNSSFMVKGINDSYLMSRSEFIKYVLSEEELKNGIIISENTAEKLNLKIGDRVAMLITNGASSAMRPDIATVYGIYSSGFAEIDDNLVYATYDYASVLFPGEEAKKTEIIISDYTSGALSKLEEKLDSYFSTTNFMQANSTVFRTLTSSNQAIILILILIIIVSAYSTMSGAEEVFFEEKKTLEIYKMLGANKAQLRITLITLVLGAVSFACLCAFIAGLPVGLLLPKIIKAFGLMSSAEGMYLLDFKSVVPVGLIFVLFLVQIVISLGFILLGIKKELSKRSS